MKRYTIHFVKDGRSLCTSHPSEEKTFVALLHAFDPVDQLAHYDHRDDGMPIIYSKDVPLPDFTFFIQNEEGDVEFEKKVVGHTARTWAELRIMSFYEIKL